MSTTLPTALLQSLTQAPGFDADAFVSVHQSLEAVTSIRVNPAKPTAALNHLPIKDDVSWCPQGRYLQYRPSFTLDPVFHGGAYYVQEASSMFIDHIVRTLYATEPAPARVLDCCAAPGGKTTLLASALPDSLIVSNEVIKTRVSVLAENVAKWGAHNVLVSSNDPRDFQRLPGYFDCIMVDAPCSGSGLFRKGEAAIAEWSEANVQLCSQRQQRILADILPSLRQHGYLIYSTCSYSMEEDEAVCDWLVATFNMEPVSIPVEAGWGVVETFSNQYKAPGYRFYPDKVKGEGFFVTCFKKTAADHSFYTGSTVSPMANKTLQSIAGPYLNDMLPVHLFVQKDLLIAIPDQWKYERAVLDKALNLRKSGVAVGEVKGKDLIPHHELALSHLLSPQIAVANVDRATALQYLRRQDMRIETAHKGWTVCKNEDINLGWMKVLPNRVNNYYPLNWRILKQ